MESIMKISEHVRTTMTQDGAVLMNIKGGSMLTLNPTGSIIWQRLSDGQTPAQIAAQLASKFGISQEQASADVNEFLEQLEAHQLIESEESAGSPRHLGAKPTSLFCNLFRKHRFLRVLDRSSK
jgi:Coenzyme PQQ synthesis protein D (PqqD)